MNQVWGYQDYVAMLRPLVGARGVTTMLTGHVSGPHDRQSYRAVLCGILWRDAREKPARLDESFFSQFPERMRVRRREGEGVAYAMRRQRENFNKVRRTLNRDLHSASIPVYVDLLYSSPEDRSRKVVNQVHLVLDPTQAQLLRERDRLRTTRGCKKVALSLGDGKRRLTIGDDLVLRLASPIRGWLTVFVFDPHQVSPLVPDEDGAQGVAIQPRRVYTLPQDIMRSVRWTLKDASGLHTVIAIVTRTQEVILPYHGAEVRTRLHRGVSREPVSIWKLPKKDLAVGCLDVNVFPARHRTV